MVTKSSGSSPTPPPEREPIEQQAEPAKTSPSSSSFSASTTPKEAESPATQVWNACMTGSASIESAPVTEVRGGTTLPEDEEISTLSAEILNPAPGYEEHNKFEGYEVDFTQYFEEIQESSEDSESVTTDQDSESELSFTGVQISLEGGQVGTVGRLLGEGTYNVVHEIVTSDGGILDQAARIPKDPETVATQEKTALFLQEIHRDGPLEFVESPPHKATYIHPETGEATAYFPRRLDSGDLYDYIIEENPQIADDHPKTPEQNKTIADGVLTGFKGLASRGVIHLDYKPSNTMLNRDPETGVLQPKLCDFDDAYIMADYTKGYDAFMQEARNSNLAEKLGNETITTGILTSEELSEVHKLNEELQPLLLKENPTPEEKEKTLALAKQIGTAYEKMATFEVGILLFQLYTGMYPYDPTEEEVETRTGDTVTVEFSDSKSETQEDLMVYLTDRGCSEDFAKRIAMMLHPDPNTRPSAALA